MTTDVCRLPSPRLLTAFARHPLKESRSMSQPPQPPQQPGQPWGQNQPPAGGPFNGQPGQPGQQYPGQPGQPGQPGGQIPFQPAGGPTPPSSGGAGGFFKSLGGRILSAVIGIIVVVAIGLGFR